MSLSKSMKESAEFGTIVYGTGLLIGGIFKLAIGAVVGTTKILSNIISLAKTGSGKWKHTIKKFNDDEKKLLVESCRSVQSVETFKAGILRDARYLR